MLKLFLKKYIFNYKETITIFLYVCINVLRMEMK